MAKDELKQGVLRKVEEYYRKTHAAKPGFEPGKTKVPYAGRVYDEKEMAAMADSLLDFWLTLGRYNDAFEGEFAEHTGLKHIAVTNSGSSANLLSVSALMSWQFRKRLKPGDEAITPASTFPTTFNPILQNNLKPVLLDIELGTYNLKTEPLRKALSKRTRLIVVPHVLGNPNDMQYLKEFAGKNDLLLIEDCCDALGSKYRGRNVGTFGNLATYSFYPAHHITLGEGGAVGTNDKQLSKIVTSLRDWGRDCYCRHDEKNPLGACKNRFGHMLGGKPYDHRYVYSNIGYNLKPLDLQCAMGVEQLKKLPDFIKARQRNFSILYEGFSRYSKYFVLPEATPKSEPSWFAFPLTVKTKKFTRNDLTTWLERNMIMTRPLFAGNILKHPAYRGVKHRMVGGLKNTDIVMENTFFIGVYPGLTEEMLSYMLEKTREFMRKYV